MQQGIEQVPADTFLLTTAPAAAAAAAAAVLRLVLMFSSFSSLSCPQCWATTADTADPSSVSDFAHPTPPYTTLHLPTYTTSVLLHHLSFTTPTPPPRCY